ncbi:MAG: FAD-binding oxidoreductase [Desulfamplus sp.]|nr:FAD-binding oxidoreductase [Desulfamplus sp.]
MKQNNSHDVIIMGGGIMGSSTAYHLLKAEPSLKVVVLEKDLSYEKASTALSMVNARIQFSLSENVQISQYAFEVLENFEDEMAVDGVKPAIFYRREGNLFLYDEKMEPAAKRAFDMQRDLGCTVEWWSPEKIKERYPIYENLEGIVAGTFGPEDGHFDAHAVLMAYKAKASSMGAKFIQDEVVALLGEKSRVVETGSPKGPGGADAMGNASTTYSANGMDNVPGSRYSVPDIRTIEGVKCASGEEFFSSHVVNCTGAWAASLLATAGIHIPVDPVKRQIIAVNPEFFPAYPLPLTILPSGFYFRTETGGLLLMGKSMDSDPVGFDFNWDNERFEMLWGELYQFAPVFESLKLVRGWAGLYAVNTMDANAILGEWPGTQGLYLANGFSGHGLQQGPAVGRYITELILKKEHSIDLSIFSPQRIIENRPIFEDGIV